MPFSKQTGHQTKVNNNLLSHQFLYRHTPAVNATIPQLIAEEHLMKYNGINATVQAVIQFAAPTIAGSILAWGSFRDVLLVDVASAMVSIGLLCAISIPFVKRADAPSIFIEMRDGVHYATNEHFLGKPIIVYGLFIFFECSSRISRNFICQPLLWGYILAFDSGRSYRFFWHDGWRLPDQYLGRLQTSH